MSDSEPDAKYVFFLPKDLEAGYFTTQFTYRGVRVITTVPDTEKGVEDCSALLKKVPEVLKGGLQEREVMKQAAGLDDELTEFFGEGDE